MKKWFLLLALVTGSAALQGCFETKEAAGPDLSGDWHLTVKDAEYRLHIIQDGPTLSGNLLRLNGEEPLDAIHGRISKDGTFDFIRDRLNQDFQGRITSNTSMPLQLGGKMMGQDPWTADKATGLTKAQTAALASPSPVAAPEPVAQETPKDTPAKKSRKRGDELPKGGKGAKFTDANCPKGWRLDTHSARNETEFICTYRSCSCEDKNNGKCEFDAVGALDQIKAPKDYTCVVESDDCTIWCEQSDALL